MSENPYAAPSTRVEDAARRRSDKPSVGARFLWTSACAFPVFMGVVMLSLPRERWLICTIGVLIFCGLSGLVAMCIPVKPKIGFIAPGIAVAFSCAYLIGTYASK